MNDVFGYTRVSTTKQGEGVSLEAQKEAIERYASQHGLVVVQWFEEKETAAKHGRPIFSAMLKLLKARKASGLILHKIDRGARNLKDWLELITLSEKGIRLHFAHESLNLQERGGRLAADIQLAVAADYIRNLSQETKKGLDGRLKQGIYPFQAPTGYLNNGKGGKQKTVDPIQAPLVQKAFRLYATRKHSLRALLVIMTKAGLKNFRGSAMKLNGLAKMLRNPFYIGILNAKSGVYDGHHEPIISTNLFNSVQQILDGKYNTKEKQRSFAFRRLVKCKTCGFSMIGEQQKGYVYYRCHTKGCPTKSIRETMLEKLLMQPIKMVELLPQESRDLNDELDALEQGQIHIYNNLLTAVRLQKTQLDEKIERLTDCYVEGGLDKATFDQRKQKLLVESKTKEIAEKELVENKGRVFSRARKILELAKSPIIAYEKGIPDERVRLLRSLTSNLQIDKKNLIVSMKSPFHELANREDFTKCAHIRDKPRNMNSTLSFSDTDALLPERKPLSKEKLKLLLNYIIEICSTLQEDNIFRDSDIPEGYGYESQTSEVDRGTYGGKVRRRDT